jgi:DNA-binding IclR family transcriptional regulator
VPESHPPPAFRNGSPRVIEDLSTVVQAEVRLGVLDNLEVAYIEKTPGQRSGGTATADARLPTHATAVGKALLAFFSQRIVDMVVAHGLTAYTPYTLTTPDRLRRALAITRLTRIAISRWELDLGISAVAAPVFGAGGHVVAALELRVRDLHFDLRVMQPALIVAAGSLSRELATSAYSRLVPGTERRLDGRHSGQPPDDIAHPGRR